MDAGEKILTVSIAAYNVEKYIRQTLDSLTDMRVIDDLEVFVIDDGGNDDTLDIVREYSLKYTNSIFPIHKENGGYGSTVNFSVGHATGKYFKLLDGDDWFDTDGLVKFINFLKYTDIDMIVNPYYFGSGNKDKKREELGEFEKNAEFNLANINAGLKMWSVAFKTSVIQKTWSDLPEKTLYTDTLYVLYGLSGAKSMYCLDYPLYCYRMNRKESSTTVTSLINHYQDGIDVAMKSAEFYERMKVANNQNLLMIKTRAGMNYAGAAKAIMYRKVNSQNLSLIKQYDKELKQLSYDVYKESEKCGKAGLMLKMMRKSGYFAYWLLPVYQFVSSLS